MAFPTTSNPNFLWNGESFNFANLKMLRDPSAFGPAVSIAAITADATGLIPLNNPLSNSPSPTRGLFVDQAGTVTGHDAFGNIVTALPLVAGLNWISLAGVTSIATITKIWGVW